jgi:hypothetical protein
LVRLKSVEIFAIGPVGYAGVTSIGEMDYHLVSLQPPERALKLFNDLFALGNVQAKAYALVGIRKLDAARFKELDAKLSSSTDSVRVESGCIVSGRKLQDVANEIDLVKFPYDK